MYENINDLIDPVKYVPFKTYKGKIVKGNKRYCFPAKKQKRNIILKIKNFTI